MFAYFYTVHIMYSCHYYDLLNKKPFYRITIFTNAQGKRGQVLSIICIANAATKVKVKEVCCRNNKNAQMITKDIFLQHNYI